MREIVGDIFVEMNNHEAVCVPINGCVRQSGAAVMGAGLAKKFAAIPGTPYMEYVLGSRLRMFSSASGLAIPHLPPMQIGAINRRQREFVSSSVLIDLLSFVGEEALLRDYTRVLTFQTKYDWRDKADLQLLEAQAARLSDLLHMAGWKSALLPRVGCGLGGLDWKDVKRVIEPHLDDRFTVIAEKA